MDLGQDSLPRLGGPTVIKETYHYINLRCNRKLCLVTENIFNEVNSLQIGWGKEK